MNRLQARYFQACIAAGMSRRQARRIVADMDDPPAPEPPAPVEIPKFLRRMPTPQEPPVPEAPSARRPFVSVTARVPDPAAALRRPGSPIL